MTALITALTLGTILLASEVSVLAQESVEVEMFQRISAEFDKAQRAAFDAARGAKTDRDREAAARLSPDYRKFDQRLLDLAREATDEATVVDALVWVIRHPGRGSGGKTPESDEAIRQIEDRFIRNGRIAGACWPIGTRGLTGERLLRRIVEENPSARVRGQACLGLAFGHRMLLRDLRRYKAIAPDRRPEWVKAYGQDRVDQIEKTDRVRLVSETENWLRRVVDDYPGAILNEQVSDFLPLLSDDLGPSAERILRRVAEAHPDAKTRRDAGFAHVESQMKLAVLVAQVRNTPPGSRVARGLEDFPGGEARLNAIDPRSLALEIEHQFLGLADHANEILESGINSYRVMMSLGSDPVYYSGAEQLLRRVAERHPENGSRMSARRSLALYLAGMANESARLRFAAGPDLSYWVDLLGEERVGQIRRMDPVRLNREAGVLADQVVAESPEVRGSPDRDIEALRRTLGSAGVGSVAPEILGTDLQGDSFKLSDYRGRVVLLDFWNHRACPSCREAYPTLRALAKGLVGRPFTVLGVDNDDEQADLAQLVKDGTVTWRFWFTHGTVAEPTFVRWNIAGVPSVVVLDHRGIIRVRYAGTPGLETLEKVVNELAKEAEGTGGSGN